MLDLPALTDRDLALLDRLAQHEPLSTSELRLLFFTGERTCRARLAKLHDHGLLTRLYPARLRQGGSTEGLWFLSPHGRRMIGAPGRRPPGLSIPDLEHRREVAQFFLTLVQRSLARTGEGLHSWLGEQHAQHGTGDGVRPDGFGRYLLPNGEVTFYLELDRSTEPRRRVKAKLDAYTQALAGDPDRDRGNVLLVCPTERRLASLAPCAPQGPPWMWGTTDGRRFRLLPALDQQRSLGDLPGWPRDPRRHIEQCLGRRWQQPAPMDRPAVAQEAIA